MTNVLISDTEKGLKRELGQRIYQVGEKVRLEALGLVGIRFPNQAKPKVQIKTGGSGLRTIFTTDHQLSIKEDVTRGIWTQDGTLRGRYFQPDGSTWLVGDSSQGPPWHELDMPMEDLTTMATQLDWLAKGVAYSVEVVLSGYHNPAYTLLP